MSTYRGVHRAVPGALLVSEVFGPTLQGEGPSAGRAAAFLRLGMCNLECTWCDTAYAWDRTRYDMRRELHSVPVEDVLSDLLSRRTPLIVVTGGEPLLQLSALHPLVVAAIAAGRRVEFETNGTIPAGVLAATVHRFVVSPKLANSQQPVGARLRWDVLRDFAELPSAEFKFVVSSPSDLREVDELVNKLAVSPERVWVMPEATTAQMMVERMRELAPGVYDRGWSLSGRVQILLWGDERGR